ncbi:hypothetical protein K435DRAFT_825019 [Dendrothele bispora CBS 962.96]|uniref:Pentacotripeptide-repeat region of PRORP domain-containing protein n=1 Tax=Dendrothele bispora (strain CBS 962.96) TaxID=1314807 RepID=A0A4S8N103_DENBC|nr:hypothetical protein K435DRAFT_825019 [Dendrothele bispora CBS 962.96]
MSYRRLAGIRSCTKSLDSCCTWYERAYLGLARDTQPLKFRSKHYDPSSEKPATEKILLEPHVLSQRLKKLCDNGQLESAVSMLKNAPRDAQNTPVWNTLIWECMKAGRYQLGYQLYTDMKRRGHSPTTRTFLTMLNGLSRIETWSSHPKQLKNAHSLYSHFQRHIDLVKRADPSSSELSTAPISAYVRILGNVGLQQEMFDVYYSLDTEGPMAPDIMLYTAFFQALCVKPSAETGWIQNSTSAKLLWNFMLKATKKRKLELDDFVISSAILAMSRGRPADQNFAFEIAAEYFGLTGPGQPSKAGSVPLKSQSLGALLAACRNSERHAEAIHFFQLVLQRPPALGGPAIVDRGHAEEVLSSYAALDIPNAGEMSLELLEWMLKEEITRPGRLDGKKIRPTFLTFNLVITACWRSKDWRSACKAFDLMTGYHMHDFMDGVVSEKPRLDARSAGRNIPPTAETISMIMRAALETENVANIRQALRLVDYLGFERLCKPPPLAVEGQLESKRARKHRHFFVVKLAQAIDDSVAFIKSSSKHKTRPDDLKKWSQLKDGARKILGTANNEDFLPTVIKNDTRGAAKPRKHRY